MHFVLYASCAAVRRERVVLFYATRVRVNGFGRLAAVRACITSERGTNFRRERKKLRNLSLIHIFAAFHLLALEPPGSAVGTAGEWLGARLSVDPRAYACRCSDRAGFPVHLRAGRRCAELSRHLRTERATRLFQRWRHCSDPAPTHGSVVYGRTVAVELGSAAGRTTQGAARFAGHSLVGAGTCGTYRASLPISQRFGQRLSDPTAIVSSMLVLLRCGWIGCWCFLLATADTEHFLEEIAMFFRLVRIGVLTGPRISGLATSIEACA